MCKKLKSIDKAIIWDLLKLAETFIYFPSLHGGGGGGGGGVKTYFFMMAHSIFHV